MKSIHSESYNIVIECLKSLRKEKNITQIELANLIKRDQTYVSKFERCERRLDIIELRTICKALGISLTDFIQIVEEKLIMKGIN